MTRPDALCRAATGLARDLPGDAVDSRAPSMLSDTGYDLVPAVLAADEVDHLVARLPAVTRGGVRSLLDDPVVQGVARDQRVRRLAGAGSFAVRAVLFDKAPDANWALGWHQDLSIATRERRDASGFGPWTVKDNVPHAIAPAALLAEMVTLRLHLDDCGADAGPLRVKPGSHLDGRLDLVGAQRWIEQTPEQPCVAARGDILVFKPLLLHASSSSAAHQHRRVLQLEFAHADLPNGLEWRWRV